VAAAVYLPALRNGLALDDGPIIELNPRAHSIAAALRAVDEPYWPPEHAAGLWRPLPILTYAVEWQLTGGNTVVMHATNIALHAAVTGLLVPFLAAYVPPAAALGAAVVFAIHPVHVEAVANVVGRAELLAALFLLLAILLARRVRRAPSVRTPLEAGLIGAVALALLSKEHAAIAVGLLLLDDLARGEDGRRLPLRLYLAVTLLTAAWLIARARVDQGLSFRAVAPTFYGLDGWGRLATMGPALLVVLRLLVWPFRLQTDYLPQVLPRLEQLTAPGALGLAVLLATAALAILSWRRHRAAAAGLLMMGLAWAPTSNLLFPTGVVIAERALYLPTVGLALVTAALLAQPGARRHRHAVLAGGVALLIGFAARTVTRIPFWKDNRELVIRGLLEHPESYKVHQSHARVLSRMGDAEGAHRAYLMSVELYPLDPYNMTEAGAGALAAGHPEVAVRLLMESEMRDSNYMLTQQHLVTAFLEMGEPAEALKHARNAVALGPSDAESARLLAASHLALGAVDSALAVWPAFEAAGGSAFDRWLLTATTQAAAGARDSALAALRRAVALATDSTALRRLREGSAEVRRLTAPATVAEDRPGLQNARGPSSLAGRPPLDGRE
jgi:tetratricopeptide (TPR) repeat protein